MSQLFVFCSEYFCVCDSSREMKNWITTTEISTITC